MSDRIYVSVEQHGQCFLCGDYANLYLGVCFDCSEFAIGHQVSPILHKLWDVRDPSRVWALLRARRRCRSWLPVHKGETPSRSRELRYLSKFDIAIMAFAAFSAACASFMASSGFSAFAARSINFLTCASMGSNSTRTSVTLKRAHRHYPP